MKLSLTMEGKFWINLMKMFVMLLSFYDHQDNTAEKIVFFAHDQKIAYLWLNFNTKTLHRNIFNFLFSKLTKIQDNSFEY